MSDDAGVRYATEVTSVGKQVAAFAGKGLLILFGDQAPAAVHDISVLHSPTVKKGGIEVGDIVEIDGRTYPILAIGGVAEANLLALGHIDLKFNGDRKAKLPGDLCLPHAKAPTLKPGSTFRIVAADAAS